MRSSLSAALALSSTGEEAVMPQARGHGAPANHGDTMTKTTARSRVEMRRLDDMPSQLAALETMNVPALAEKYQVSDMTIRRDARRLEEQGIARSVHGGLMLPHGTMHGAGFAARANDDSEAKHSIAAACIEIIGPHERVFIDAGTTAYSVARALPAAFAGTLITHSAPVMQVDDVARLLGAYEHVTGRTSMPFDHLPPAQKQELHATARAVLDFLRPLTPAQPART